MKKASFVLLVMLFFLVGGQSELNSCSNSVIIYAPPYNVFSPAVEVFNCFGENVGCKITVDVNNTGGTIRIKIRKHRGNNGEDWQEYLEGTWIKAQVVEAKVASTGPGGSISLYIKDGIVKD